MEASFLLFPELAAPFERHIMQLLSAADLGRLACTCRELRRRLSMALLAEHAQQVREALITIYHDLSALQYEEVTPHTAVQSLSGLSVKSSLTG